MRRIEEPRLVEKRPPIVARREREGTAIERPTLAAGNAARREHVPERDGGAVRQVHLEALAEPGAGKASRRVRRQDQHAAGGHLGKGLALAAADRAVDARRSL